MEATQAAQTEEAGNVLLIKFIIDNEAFGVNIGNVREIIEIPKITSVPNTPDYFVGIINLRGNIISVIDARLRFGLPPNEFDEFSRITIIYFKGGLIGIIVDDVSEVVRMTSNKIQPAPSILKGIDTNYLRGVVKLDSGEMILLLNLEEMVKLSEFAREEGHEKFLAKDFEYEKVEKKEESIQIITFYLQDELYSINIQDAEEIIQLPEIIPIPQSPEFIRGVISIRGDIIPIVDLHVRFNYDEITIDKNSSIIVVDVGRCMIGLMVDAISGIMRVPKKIVTTPPPTLSKGDIKQLHGILKITDGDKSKIVSCISLNDLFTEEEIALLSEVREDKSGGEDKSRQKVVDEPFVVVNFCVGEDIFTIPVDVVVEIAKYPSLTKVPNAPSFVQGVLNLRGDIVFVMDLRERFGFPKKGVTEDTRVIIADIEGIKTGLIVDEVDSVKTIYKSQIEEAPRIVSSIENEYISSVIKIKDSDDIMIMLNLYSLLNTAEKKAVKSMDLEKVSKQASKGTAKRVM